MATIIRDPILEQRLQAERGADRYDEVWDGVYIMSPMPNDEHQMLVGRLTRVLDEVIADNALGQVRPGVNVSDRVEGWQQNYRVPDVAVFLNDTRAVNHDAFWHGGPDFAIEIVSPGDQTREKLDFYADVATRELLIIDRAPWQLELYRNDASVMNLVTTASPDSKAPIYSEVVCLNFDLIAGTKRPRTHVVHSDSGREWTI